MSITETILQTYPDDCHPSHIQHLGNAGGFSGAQLWRLQSPRGELCLRKWPSQHPSSDQLIWIHDVLVGAHQQGCDFLPVPIANLADSRFVRADGSLWEVTRWMPGEASLAQSSWREKLRSAMQSLARFHNAAEKIDSTVGRSRGLGDRSAFVARLLSGQLDQLPQNLQRHRQQPFFEQCELILQLATPRIRRLPAIIGSLHEQSFALLPCLRDIWHNHILFEGKHVSGIIDFGAMRIETAAADIGRLLASIERDATDVWPIALEAYRHIRPVSQLEEQAARAFAACNVALSGMNWVRWLLLDGRTFEDSVAVGKRLQEILCQLEMG